MINSPIHTHGNIIDQLLCNHPNLLKAVCISPNDICQSDHFSVCFKLRSRVPKKMAPKISKFNYKKSQMGTVNRDFLSIDWKPEGCF